MLVKVRTHCLLGAFLGDCCSTTSRSSCKIVVPAIKSPFPGFIINAN